MSPEPGDAFRRRAPNCSQGGVTPNNKLTFPSLGLMIVGMVAPPSGSGAQVPSFVGKRRDLPRMMEHLVPVCYATLMPIGGSSKLESRTTLIHAYSTTPEIVASSLCSVTHPEE